MFRKLLLRNLIFMIIPALIIEASLVFICIQLKSLDENITYQLNSLDDIPVYYRLAKRNVSLNLDYDLVYSGFDMKTDDGIKGRYYYMDTNDKMYLFILTNETSKLIDRGDAVTIKATISEDEASSDFIESEYTNEMKLGNNSLDGYVEKYIVSEPEYPARRIILINYTMAAAIIMVIITVLYFIVAAVFPELNMLFRLKGLASSRKKLIKKLDKEMNDTLISAEGSVYTTDNYIIKANVSYIDIEKRPAH